MSDLEIRGALAWAKADEENSCEQCWEALRADLAKAGLPDPANLDVFAVPAAWTHAQCAHGAPKHADRILLYADLTCAQCGKVSEPTREEAEQQAAGTLLDDDGDYHCAACWQQIWGGGK